MVEEGQARTPIVCRGGQEVGKLRVRVCRQQGSSQQPPSLLWVPGGPAPALQILEGTEYYYAWELEESRKEHKSTLRVDIHEVFHPNEDCRAGRLRPRLETGTLSGKLYDETGFIGSFELEVRSKKLGYLDEYQWMLRDITETFSDVILQRFATSAHAFSPDTDSPARSLYQRFAFLKASLDREELRDALHLIFSRPHLRWATIEERRPPGSSLPPTSAVARQIALPGPRTPWADGESLGIPSLPQRMSTTRTVPDVDNSPNRFVKHALEHWRGVVAELRARMVSAPDSASVNRGRDECGALLDQLDTMLEQPLMRNVGRLSRFPTGNQVLQKKPGYRTVLKTFLLGELASNLTWEGGEDVYGIGKRDVATLYEYWTYLALAKVLGDVIGTDLDLSTLLEADGARVSVKLKRGKTVVVSGTCSKWGTPLDIELYFNRQFGAGKTGEAWTRTMRPDCSLRIGLDRGYDPPLRPVWLHFDAKYRVEDVAKLFGTSDPQPEEAEAEVDEERATGLAKRTDLLKMHAYRDAIRHSLGAFVLYPGDAKDCMSRYREILPGLGAFPLRPDPHGVPRGSADIRAFLTETLDLLAEQTSRQERHRYWKRRIYANEERPQGPTDNWASSPPADLRVTLGYVRSQEHLDWIVEHRMYNVRADDRVGTVELDSPVLTAYLLLLYFNEGPEICAWRPSGKVSIRTGAWLRDHGYPSPRGEAYLCLGLSEPIVEPMPGWLVGDVVRRSSREGVSRWGTPVAVSWGDLIRAGAGETIR